MEKNVQVIFRTDRRTRNLMDRAADEVGLSRSQWIVSTLSQRLFGPEKHSLGPVTLQSAFTTQMMLEAWLSSRVEPSAIQQIRQTAKQMVEKYYDA